MRIVGNFLTLLAAVCIFLKFFTYEFYLSDDATSGLALRIGLVTSNHQMLEKRDIVLLADENEFLAAPLYHFAVGSGWLVLPLLSILLLGRITVSPERQVCRP